MELNPKGSLPFIQDAEFRLAESSAILKYFCNSRAVPEHWFPKESQKQAKTNEFLDWFLLKKKIHHNSNNNTNNKNKNNNNNRYHCTLRRNCIKYVMGKHYSKQLNQPLPSEESLQKMEKEVIANLQFIESNYLQEFDFLNGN